MSGDSMLEQSEFNSLITTALATNAGFAAGKLSVSPIQRLNYSRLVARNADARLLKLVGPTVLYHGYQQQGIFPADLDFYLYFNDFYAGCLGALNVIGIFPELLEQTQSLFAHFEIQKPLVDFRLLEPDRSLSAADERCYLPLFRDRKIIIICPFADLLAERANQQTFERVWAKTGKRWFQPAGVEGLELPYGFDVMTQARYTTSIALYEAILVELQRREFDVALIAAAGLAVPLAAAVKSMGRIALDMGGHLQVLFGVIGKRWRESPEWQQYFNEAWIDMPERYRPTRSDVCDNGAYW